MYRRLCFNFADIAEFMNAVFIFNVMLLFSEQLGACDDYKIYCGLYSQLHFIIDIRRRQSSNFVLHYGTNESMDICDNRKDRGP